MSSSSPQLELDAGEAGTDDSGSRVPIELVLDVVDAVLNIPDSDADWRRLRLVSHGVRSHLEASHPDHFARFTTSASLGFFRHTAPMASSQAAMSALVGPVGAAVLERAPTVACVLAEKPRKKRNKPRPHVVSALNVVLARAGGALRALSIDMGGSNTSLASVGMGGCTALEELVVTNIDRWATLQDLDLEAVTSLRRLGLHEREGAWDAGRVRREGGRTPDDLRWPNGLDELSITCLDPRNLPMDFTGRIGAMDLKALRLHVPLSGHGHDTLVELLERHTRLETLEVGSPTQELLRRSGLGSRKSLKHLRVLQMADSLYNNPSLDPRVINLATSSLLSLNLSGVYLDSLELDLANNASLVQLDFSYCDALSRPFYLAQLGDQLAHNRTLQVLKLRGLDKEEYRLTDDGLRGMGLERNVGLKVLHLEGNPLQGDMHEWGLDGHTTLEELHIGWRVRVLGPPKEHIDAIVAALSTSPTRVFFHETD